MPRTTATAGNKSLDNVNADHSATQTRPLVSILCRSMNRPELVEALASVERQSYPNIEIILVDASGKGLTRYQSMKLQTPVHEVSGGGRWNRPAAANIALKNAHGSYLMFLDEDDWIANDHVEKLMDALRENTEFQAAYSGVQNADVDGTPLDSTISVPFNEDLLKKDNFLPIHAVLFSSNLRDQGCKFDENLDIYEDWDFWLQCSQITNFLHVDRISAWYRQGGASETIVKDEKVRYQDGHPIAIAREKVLGKWLQKWTGTDINHLIGALDNSALISDIHADLVSAHEIIQTQGRKLEVNEQEKISLRHQFDDLTDEHRKLQQDNQILNQAHRELDQAVREILSSFSWRAMGPYRRVKRSLDARVINPLRRFLEFRKKKPITHSNTDSQVCCDFLNLQPDQKVVSENFTLQGWAWSPAALKSIEILIDDKKFADIEPDYVKKLTGNHNPDMNDARQTGFALLIDAERVTPGEHTLTMRVRDLQGQENNVCRHFVQYDGTSQYLLWRSRQAASTIPAPSSQSTNNQSLVDLLINYTGNLEGLKRTLSSIHSQARSDWNCHILCASDQLPHIQPLVTEVASTTSNFRLHLITSVQEVFTETRKNTAWLCCLEAGEEIADGALKKLSQQTGSDALLIYSDHDMVDNKGSHCCPWFTPNWSPELFLNQNYVGGFYLLNSKLLQSGDLDEIEITESAWRYKLLLQMTLKANLNINHTVRIAEVLWSAPVMDSAGESDLADSELRAVQTSLGESAQVTASAENPLLRYVQWSLEEETSVAIIIPTTGNPRYLEPCLNTLRKITSYTNYAVIILDNGRGKHPDGIEFARQWGATIIECDEDFNWSRLNNTGAVATQADLLLFLNDDIEIIDPQWLRELARLAVRPDTGTVGSLLLYPNGAIQHAGVFVVDHGGGARHLLHRQLPGKGIYQALDRCAREVSANTGACLMISRNKFEALNKFNEKLPVVGNDIDLCLRCLEAGYRNIWTPHSRLIHHESVSRKNKPIGKDENAMWQRWGPYFLQGDSYYNPNLTLLKEDCSLKPLSISANWNCGGSDAAAENRASLGVNLIAYIRAEMGVGEASRGNASALEAAKIPFGIINYEKANPARMTNLSWQHKEIQQPKYDINIIHINADHTPSVIADLGEEYFKGRYNIGFWAWELPEFPDRWLESFKLLDEIWVPSTFVNNAVAQKSPIPVVTIPHAIDIDSSLLQNARRSDFDLPKEAFVFLSMFDIHSIAQRKNPYGSIIAFQTAFSPDDMSVVLAIKINNADQATLKSLREFIGEYRNIQLIDMHLDRIEINSLISVIDCYVSLHHSEGFGLGPAEAMALGKVAMLTAWSGNTEYMTSQNCIGIGYKLVPLDRDYGPYEKGQIWAAPDINEAAEAMSKLSSDPEWARAIGRHARMTIEEEFSPERIGSRMRKRLESIVRSTVATK